MDSVADAAPDVAADDQVRGPNSRADSHLVLAEELTFTVVTSHSGPLAKEFSLNENGGLETRTTAQLVEGEARVEHARSIQDFLQRLDTFETNQAVLYGIPSLEAVRVVTQKRLDRLPATERHDVIARTREFLQFAPAPGILMLDFDPGNAPTQLLEAIANPEELRALLIRAVPELEDAPMAWRPSSSSYLYEGTRELHGLRGQRVYIALARASDGPTFGKLLYDRLWLLGYGFVVVSKSGQTLERAIIDQSVWQPERLDFAAGPVTVPPLERRPRPAITWRSDGPFFDVTRVTPLSAHDRALIEAHRRSALAGVKDVARGRKTDWIRERVKELAPSLGGDEKLAAAVAEEAVENRILRPEFTLTTDDGRSVEVADLLADPYLWHERRFHDPLEPDYRGDNRIAWANMRPSRGRPYIYSHAHGGTRYEISNGKETIRLEPGEHPKIVDKLSEILVEESEVYQYRDQMARVTDNGQLAPVEPEWMTDWLQRRTSFTRYDKSQGKWLPSDLPLRYAKTVLAKNGEIGLPPLVAITKAPFVRTDGALVDEPGYDPSTHVLYRPLSPVALRVRRELMKSEAGEVLRTLWAPFSKFPFVSDVDRGTVLALVLTAVMRAGLPIAPGGLIESHEAGSGKTLLAQSVASLTGSPAVPQAFPQVEDEVRKGMFAAARAGVPSVLFDNVGRDRIVDSAALSMVLTSGTIADRILGESTYATLPFRALILLTGNNPRIAGDLNRRLIRARIIPNVENPWQRVFDFDPRARTEANWLGMRIAALELGQAALVDGIPDLAGGSGYPDWDKLVRAPVVWAAQHLDIGVGFADPIQSLLAGYTEDPERDRLRRVMVSMRAVFGDRPATVTEMTLKDRLFEANAIPNEIREAVSQLDEVLQELAGPRGGNQAIGIYLGQQKGRIVDGMELTSPGRRNGSTLWLVRLQNDGVSES